MNTDVTTHDPTINGVIAPPPAAAPKVDEAELMGWFAELERLRRERPRSPTIDDERLEDLNWFFEQFRNDALAPHARRFVAIRLQRLVGVDDDPTWLELSLARQHPDLHPDSFLIEFVG